MKNIFQNSFYSIFRASNADEIISNIEMENVDDNLLGSDCLEICRVKKYSLDAEKYSSLLRPSFKIFAKELKTLHWTLNNPKPFLIDIQQPWLSCYHRGGFQELYDHNTFDFSCVFFINDGEGFSELQFFDRNYINVSARTRDLLNITSSHTPQYNAGDIIIFPSHMMHCVSIHNSDIIRKTLSTNLRIVENGNNR